MTDEKYIFLQDCKEKKRTAAGAFHRRNHAGKGGAIKFPSDYMTRKERRAMNGETKTYRLNDPMDWKEYKAMPDDIRVLYVKALREKFNVPDRRIAEMLGVSQRAFAYDAERLGIALGRGHGGRRAWDERGWLAFVGDPESVAEEERPEVEGVPEVFADVDEVHSYPCSHMIPIRGEMTFGGAASEALDQVKMLLCDANVKITVSWEVVE